MNNVFASGAVLLLFISIDIDELGTGIFSDTHRTWEPSNTHATDQVATRTETDDSITWTGSFYEVDSSAYCGIDLQFSTETRIIDEQTRWQQGTVSSSATGLPFAPIDIWYSLTGTISNENSYCLPDFGTITFTAQYEIRPSSLRSISLKPQSARRSLINTGWLSTEPQTAILWRSI